MTTAAPGTRTFTVAPGLRGAAVTASGAGIACILVAVLTADRPAVLGASIGTVLVVGTFAFGALTVDAVASRLPAAALLIAVLTYTLQVVFLAFVFMALTSSGVTDRDVDPQWLGITAIVVTLAWIAAQTVGATRARVPLYDLPTSPPSSPPRATAEDRRGNRQS